MTGGEIGGIGRPLAARLEPTPWMSHAALGARDRCADRTHNTPSASAARPVYAALSLHGDSQFAELVLAEGFDGNARLLEGEGLRNGNA